MSNKPNVEYLLSVHILRNLKERNLISDEEFDAIDRENRRSFKYYDNKKIA